MANLKESREAAAEEFVDHFRGGFERGRDMAFYLAKMVLPYQDLPTCRTVNVTDVENVKAVVVPLKGEGELRILKRLGERNALVVKMKFVGTDGKYYDDQLVIKPGKESLLISDTDHAHNGSKGLKFLAGFDPFRDIDEDRRNGDDPKQNTVISLLKSFGQG